MWDGPTAESVCAEWQTVDEEVTRETGKNRYLSFRWDITIISFRFKVAARDSESVEVIYYFIVNSISSLSYCRPYDRWSIRWPVFSSSRDNNKFCFEFYFLSLFNLLLRNSQDRRPKYILSMYLQFYLIFQNLFLRYVCLFKNLNI